MNFLFRAPKLKREILLILILFSPLSLAAESWPPPQNKNAALIANSQGPAGLSGSLSDEDSGTDMASAIEKVLTLQEAERLALLNDATVLSAEQDKIMAAERVKEAGYLFLPEVGVQASATKYNALYPFALPAAGNALLFPQNTLNLGNSLNSIMFGGAYMNMNLYEGGRGVNTYKLAEAAQKQAESAYESARMNVILAVERSFYHLLLIQKEVQIEKDYLSQEQTLAEDSHLDIWEQIAVQTRLAQTEAKYARMSHQLRVKRLQFLKSLNLELDTPFRIVGEIQTSPVTMDVEKAVLWSLELRPELQSETYKAQMDAISVNLAQSRRTPTVFISGDYDLMTQNFPVDKNNWDATIGMKLPFAYDYISELNKKRAEQRQGDIKRSELQDQVRLEVREAYADIVYWQREYPALEKQYLRLKNLYQRASQSPGKTLLKIRALSALLNLKISTLEAVTHHLLAKAALERAIGRTLSP